MSSQPRLHALDNLRAVMMWLGIVLHVATVHQVFESSSFWRDPQTTPVADVLVTFIHIFRMPAFIAVAGFFVALLVERRGPGGMLAHRAMRVGLPFIVFLPILFAVTVALANMHAQPIGSVPALSFDLQVMPEKSHGLRFQTLHLWFLYLLMGFAFAASVLYRLAAKVRVVLRARVKRVLGDLAESNAACVFLALPLALAERHYAFGVLLTSGDLLPAFEEWLHYGLYFAFGLLLYHCRDRLLPLLERRVWSNVLAGFACIGVMTAVSQVAYRFPAVLPDGRAFMSLAYNACGWFWTLALIGGFLRYLSRRSELLMYLAESSYWVYLVHLPIIGAVALALREWTIGAASKVLINILATTLVTVLSYHLLVRNTRLGTFLNGSPRRIDDPVRAASAAR